MGFDIGAFIGNLYLAYFAQSGHEAKPGARDDYRAWILATAEQTWTLFDRRFRALWTDRHGGDAFVPGLFHDATGPAALGQAQDAYMRRLFIESLGFAGCKMTRRILGLAHVEDMESIVDLDQRASCEKRALRLARSLMVEGAAYPDIKAVSDAVRALLLERVT
jgi:5-methylthioribose kinase